MHIRKLTLPDKGKRLLKVLIGFTGKTRDEVAGKTAARKAATQQFNRFIKTFGIIFAVHGFQGFVTAGLQAEVEVPTQLSAFRKPTAEILRDDGRFQRAETDTHSACILRYGTDNIRKTGLSGQIDAVGSDFDPREDKFPVALFRHTACLGGSFFKRQAAQPAPRIRNDAVGAEIHTAVLDFQHGTRPPGDGSGRQFLIDSPLKRIIYFRYAPAGRKSCFHSLNKALMISRPEHNPGAAVQSVLRAQLGITAAHTDNRPGVLLLQTADKLAGFPSAFCRDSTGVDDDSVRCLSRCSRHMPAGQENGLHRLCFILIDFASES